MGLLDRLQWGIEDPQRGSVETLAKNVLPEEVTGGMDIVFEVLRDIIENAPKVSVPRPSGLEGEISTAAPLELLLPQSYSDLPFELLGPAGDAMAMAVKGGGKKLGKTLKGAKRPKATAREGYAHGAQGSVEENFREAAGTIFVRVDRSGKVTPLPKGVDAKATSSDAIIQVNADGSRFAIDGDVMSYKQEQAINALQPGEIKDIGEAKVYELIDEPVDETEDFLRTLGVESGEGVEKLKAVIKPGTARPGAIKISKDMAENAVASTERYAGSKRAAKDLPIPEVKVSEAQAARVIPEPSPATEALLDELKETITGLPKLVAKLTKKKEFRGIDKDILIQGLRDEIENEALKLGAPMDEVNALMDNALDKLVVRRPKRVEGPPDETERILDQLTDDAMKRFLE